MYYHAVYCWDIFSSDFHNLLQWSLSVSTMNFSVFNDNICPWIMRFFHKSSDILTWPINFEKITHFLTFLTSNWDNLFQNILKYNKWNMIDGLILTNILNMKNKLIIHGQNLEILAIVYRPTLTFLMPNFYHAAVCCQYLTCPMKLGYKSKQKTYAL